MDPPLRHSTTYSREEARQVIRQLNHYRTTRTRPGLSHFRVLAILVYETPEGNLQQVLGANAEPCSLSGSICAERSCLVQLRLVSFKKLVRIYIVTDATTQLPPGMLCREFLSSVAHDDLLICLANASSEIIETTTLQALYPHPLIYRHVDRAEVVAYAEKFRARGLEPPSRHSPEAQATYESALKACNRDALYPIRFGAATRFSNGSVAMAWQKKGLEYGTTLDAVTQLAPAIEEAVGGGVRVELVLHVDQYGILHAPSASARAYLSEYGHGDCTILIHEPREGALVAVQAADLAPLGPDIKFEENVEG